MALAQEVAERSWAAVESARADAALQESEARFRNMADHAPVMMWVTDPHGACLYLNRRWYEFTGQPEAEALGLGWTAGGPPRGPRPRAEAVPGGDAARQPFRAEYRLRRVDGEYRWAIDAAAPRFGEGGEFLGFVGSVIDITERKQAEQHQRLLINELNHRVKNTLATVQAMAAPDPAPREARDAAHGAFDGAAAGAGAGARRADPRELGGRRARRCRPEAMAAVRGGAARSASASTGRRCGRARGWRWPWRWRCTNWPPTPEVRRALGARGRVEIDWQVDDTGREPGCGCAGGARRPAGRAAASQGFGSRLLGRALAAELAGEVRLDYAETGVVCDIDAPLRNDT